MRGWGIGLLLLLAVMGCGRADKPVAGMVRLDGEPLADGKIYFLPVDGKPPVVGKIEQGRFEVRAGAGKHRVEIRSFREVIPCPEPPNDPVRNFLPSRYNAESELTAEVEPGQSGEITFTLVSDRPE